MMTAVLLIIFNRPATTHKVFEVVRSAQPARLYIASDAPRAGNTTDEERCKLTRAVTENIDWPCEVKRLYQEKNLGCSFGPRAAFDWFFSHEEEGIILEDDCVPHKSFFSFATEMLERYRHNKKIISINGSNLGYKPSHKFSYSFSRYMNMWGWATWADRAKAIDYSLKDWRGIEQPLSFLHTKLRNHPFDFDTNWYRYWQHKFDLSSTGQKVSWWDWQWIWHQINNNQLSIIPAVNLVTNIGFNDSATHTKATDNPASNIQLGELKLPLLHPSKIHFDEKYETEFVKNVWCFYKDPGGLLKFIQKLKFSLS